MEAPALVTKYFVVALGADGKCFAIEDARSLRISLCDSMGSAYAGITILQHHYPARKYLIREIDVPSTWQYCILSEIIAYSYAREYDIDPLLGLDVEGMALDEDLFSLVSSFKVKRGRVMEVKTKRRIRIRKPNE